MLEAWESDPNSGTLPVIQERGVDMSLRFKVNVLEMLKAAGYSTYRIRKDKLLSESTVQKLRAGEALSWENIETICRLLECQPGDIMEYVPDGEDGGGE